MRHPPEPKRTLRAMLVFITHQFIATLGVGVAAAFLTVFTFTLLRPLSPHLFASRNAHLILTRVPHFPMQVILGLWSGWSFGRRFQHRSMLWVWVVPLLITSYAVMSLPTLMPDQTSVLVVARDNQSPISHYFGRGCRVEDRCEDQLLVTMPLYASIAYSVGALMARKMRRNVHLAHEEASGNPASASST